MAPSKDIARWQQRRGQLGAAQHKNQAHPSQKASHAAAQVPGQALSASQGHAKQDGQQQGGKHQQGRPASHGSPLSSFSNSWQLITALWARSSSGTSWASSLSARKGWVTSRLYKVASPSPKGMVTPCSKGDAPAGIQRRRVSGWACPSSTGRPRSPSWNGREPYSTYSWLSSSMTKAAAPSVPMTFTGDAFCPPGLRSSPGPPGWRRGSSARLPADGVGRDTLAPHGSIVPGRALPDRNCHLPFNKAGEQRAVYQQNGGPQPAPAKRPCSWYHPTPSLPPGQSPGPAPGGTGGNSSSGGSRESRQHTSWVGSVLCAHIGNRHGQGILGGLFQIGHRLFHHVPRL